ncbi:MAG: hypothetical protein H6837_10235 [Planctomycetes bacterium]|nr:hypothetical protein [Planctomycetota bacterium]
MSWIHAVFAAASLLPQGSPKPTKPDESGQKSAQADAPRFKPVPIPRALVKALGDRKITIDGALDDWPKVVPISLRDPRQVSGTALGAYRGPNDISAQLYMLWDAQYLYVAAQVLDDWHRGLPSKAGLRQEIPPVDHVMLIFDPERNTRDMGDDRGRVEDRGFYLADLERTAGKLITWDLLRGSKTVTPGGSLQVTRRDKEGVTIYEARIPWDAVLPPGQHPQLGRVLDLQILVDDFDEATDSLPQTRVGWTFGMGPQISPALWGSIMLIGQQDLGGEAMPAFPPPPAVRSSVPEREYWIELLRKIRGLPPAFVTESDADPALVGGSARHQALLDLEGFLRSYPRLDNLGFHHRVQRRMVREIAGLVQSGLPFYWDQTMRDLQRRATPAPPKGTIRVFRLPQGGFYVRSDTVNFAVDPCGVGVERLFVEGGIDFVVLTRPAEVTRRQDPLLVRMSAAKPKRQFFTHLQFHLTGAVPGSMSVVKPFTDYRVGGLRRVTPIGMMTADGKVTMSYGYLVEWEDGRSLMAAGLSVSDKELAKVKVRPDVLLLSAAHDSAAHVATRIAPKCIVLDDTLIAEEYPAQFGGRVSYAKALALQSKLKPCPSVILAPGESIDVRK